MVSIPRKCWYIIKKSILPVMFFILFICEGRYNIIKNERFEYVLNKDGRISYRDWNLGINVTYPQKFYIDEKLRNDAVVVKDKEDGYVILRNVDDIYSNYNGTGDKFVQTYIRKYLYEDIYCIFGDVVFDGEVQYLYPDKEGRIATVIQNLYAEGERKRVNTLIYFVSFNSGDTKVLAKTYIADFDNDEQMKALSEIKSGAIK